MATNIVKPMNCRSLLAGRAGTLLRRRTGDDQRFIGNLGDEIIARLRDLTLMPGQHPLLRKDILLFSRKNLRRNEKSLWKGLRSRRETLGRLLKRGCFGDRRHVAMLACPRCTRQRTMRTAGETETHPLDQERFPTLLRILTLD